MKSSLFAASALAVCAAFLSPGLADSVQANDPSPLVQAIRRSDLEAVKQLLAQGASPHEPRPATNIAPPLGEAYLVKSIPIFEALLSAGADIQDAVIMNSDTLEPCLQSAVKEGHDAFFELLLKRGSWVNRNSDSGTTALWWAARLSRLAQVKALVEAKASMGILGGDRRFGHILTLPLTEAIRAGHSEVIDFLLSSGSPVGQEATRYPYKEVTPLYAAVDTKNVDLARRLLERGANVNSTIWDLPYDRPLRLAIALKDSAMIDLLLAARPDLNYIDSSHPNELMLAARSGDLPLLKRLLAAGADPNKIRTGSGDVNSQLPPLHEAVLLQDFEMVRVLLDASADPGLMSYDGRYLTPLHLAAEKGSLPIAKLLVDRGAPVDAVDHRGNPFECSEGVCWGTALTRAAHFGHLAIAELLIRAKANINHCPRDRDPCGPTPLLHAVRMGHLDIMDLLLKNGADLKAEDFSANVFLHIGITQSAASFERIAASWIKYGGAIDHLNQDGVTALHLVFATRELNVDAEAKAKTLLKLKAKVDPLSRTGSTPLMYASGLFGPGYLGGVKTLLAAKANASLKNKSGQRAVDIARNRGHKDIEQAICKAQPGACK